MTSATSIVRSAAALAALVLMTSLASAQTAQERSACIGDAFRFCSSDIPNVSAIEACLQRNEANLTPACRAEFTPAPQRTRLRAEHLRQ
jgi:hypothetical protein